MLNYKRLHWFPFCPPDWQSKIISLGLSVPGEGCLIALACIQWQDGSIPADRQDLIRCLRGYDGPGLDEALRVFRPAFSSPSRLHWPLIEALREEAVLAHKKRAEAGRKGGQKSQSMRPQNRTELPDHFGN